MRKPNKNEKGVLSWWLLFYIGVRRRIKIKTVKIRMKTKISHLGQKYFILKL